MTEAKKRLDINVMEGLSIQKEPYEQEPVKPMRWCRVRLWVCKLASRVTSVVLPLQRVEC